MQRLLATAAIWAAFGAAARADNWTTWRGPNNDGVSRETHKIPAEWSETKNVLWKLKMPGKAGSTPVVWKDKIFLTSADGNDLALLCVSTDGKILWNKKVATAVRLAIKYDEANEASASPCVDAENVYVFVGSGTFACFDHAGNEKWSFDVQKRYGKFQIQHGIHVTPVLKGDRLYWNLLHANSQWVIALDTKTGNEVWKIERPSDAKGESREAYASPCLWHDGKQEVLVVLGSDYATGHNLADGKEVWRIGELNPKKGYSTALRIIASPVATPKLLVVPTARGGLLVTATPGAGGKVDGWRTPKGCPDVTSAVVHDGLVYLPRDAGVFLVLDAATGKEVYAERLHSDRYRASPVLADGKLIVTSRDGTFAVVKAGPKFALLATNSLQDVFSASPAIANGRIYLRGFSSLYAIGEKQ